MKRIAIIGMGNLGFFLSQKLLNHKSFLSDNHLTLVFKNKNQLLSYRRNTPNNLVFASLDLLLFKNLDYSYDYYFILVKSYSLNKVIDFFQSSPNKTTLVFFLNGLDIFEKLKVRLKKHNIIPTVPLLSIKINDSYLVEYISPQARIYYSFEYTNHDNFLERILNSLGVGFKLTSQIKPYITLKYAFAFTFGLTSALYDCNLGQILNSPSKKKVAIKLLTELNLLLKAYNISAISFDSIAKLKAIFGLSARSSLQNDLLNRNKTELFIYTRYLIVLGKKKLIELPTVTYIYGMLRSKYQHPSVIH